ncbi:MAG: hypothetical protein JWN40_4680 [Phycisphaerales bacterium]|nr:hypothetical protein [Phycisphaerales bacterium]
MLARLCACILLVLTCGAGAAVPTTAPAIEVRVTHVISDRFPVLSDAELATVLKTASEMIATGYQRDVRFVPAKPAARTSADFFGDLRKRIHPYALSRAEHFDIFEGKLEDCAPAFLGAVRHTDDLSNLHKFLGRPQPFTDEATAARALLGAYGDRLAKLKSLRMADGSPRLNQATYHQASLAQWEVYLTLAGPKTDYDLIVSNGLLIEEPIESAAFHTLVTATANGMAFPFSNNCTVGYFALLSGDPDIRADHLGALSAAERLAAIAYAVAHEVGTHLIMLRYDDYSPDAGLARPLLVVRDKSEILSYASWSLPTARTRSLNLTSFRCAVARTRIGIAAARGDADALFKELDVLEALPVDQSWKDSITAWAYSMVERSTRSIKKGQ